MPKKKREVVSGYDSVEEVYVLCRLFQEQLDLGKTLINEALERSTALFYEEFEEIEEQLMQKALYGKSEVPMSKIQDVISIEPFFPSGKDSSIKYNSAEDLFILSELHLEEAMKPRTRMTRFETFVFARYIFPEIGKINFEDGKELTFEELKESIVKETEVGFYHGER